MRLAPLMLLAAMVGHSAFALAGEVDVVDVSVRAEGGGAYAFEVTLRHDDEGWNHYADRWEVLGPDGAVFGTRKLLHPHVAEQPFTRALGGVAVPPGIAEVQVRGHDSVHGYGGREVTVRLPDR